MSQIGSQVASYAATQTLPVFSRREPANSQNLYKVGNWYIGSLQALPPPRELDEEWERTLERLVQRLQNIADNLPRRIPPGETIVEPVLCMAGKAQHSAYGREVLLEPTVWLYCGGPRCKSDVEKFILPNEPPLRDFLQRPQPPPLRLRIATEAPVLAAEESTLYSSAEDIRNVNISFAVQYPPSQDSLRPATARYTVGSKQILSTIGGPINVNGYIYGLTTAHGIASYRDRLEEELESLASSSIPEIPSSSTFKESDAYLETGEPPKSEWKVSNPPKVLAYLGRGTRDGLYPFSEDAPKTSDFALIDTPWYRNQKGSVFRSVISKDELCPGEVFVSTTEGLQRKGYLLKGTSYLVMRGAVMQTMKIQMESPAPVGISGAWVVRQNKLCGIVYAVYKESSYIHMLCAEDVFRDIFTFLFPRNYVLSVAIKGNYPAIVRRLITEGADVNAYGGEYSNPLQMASYKGYEQIVKLLLESGADINAQDGSYGSALRAASEGGHTAVVKLLLDKGADVNAQDGSYGSALRAASDRGHEQIVKLLENAAHVNAEASSYSTAVKAFSYTGTGDMANLPLGMGATFNVHGERYGSAVKAASYKGEADRESKN